MAASAFYSSFLAHLPSSAFFLVIDRPNVNLFVLFLAHTVTSACCTPRFSSRIVNLAWRQCIVEEGLLAGGYSPRAIEESDNPTPGKGLKVASQSWIQSCPWDL